LINVGSFDNSPNIFFSIAKVDKDESLSFVIEFLKKDLIHFKVLMDLSLEAVVAGIVNTN
jgi:hypothetical protein